MFVTRFNLFGARAATLACVVALTCSTVACSGNSAQSSGTSNAGTDSAPGQGTTTAGGRHRMARALMSLGLSDTQKQQIRAVMRSVHAQNAGVTDPTVRRANFRAGIAKVDAILTPAQRTKLHAELHDTQGGGGPSSAPPQN